MPRIDARLADRDGSETLKLELLGLPAGTVVSDGVRSVTLRAANQALKLTGWDWGKLGVKPPSGFTGTLQLQWRATSEEASNEARATATQAITVTVLNGAAVATPMGANPFVVPMAHATVVTSAPSPQITVGAPVVTATGTPQFAAAAPATGRSWQEEEEAARAARHALYAKARQRNPARWSGDTRDWSHIGVVALNPERDTAANLRACASHTHQKAA